MLYRHVPKKKLLLLCGDIFIISIMPHFAEVIRQITTATYFDLLSVTAYLLLFYLFDLYDVNGRFRSARYIFRYVSAITIAFMIISGIYFFVPAIKSGRGLFLISIGLISVSCYVWRLIFERCFRNYLDTQKNLLIVGAGRAGKTFYRAIKDYQTFNVVGFIDDDAAKWGTSNSPTVLGGCEMLRQSPFMDNIDAIVLAITHIKGPELLRRLLECKTKQIMVHDMPSFYELVTGKIPINHVDDYWFVAAPLSGLTRSIYNRKVKRLLDVFLSFTGLLATLPITIPTALAIGLESQGPFFYRQKRVGVSGSVFHVIKFRSMTVDAEKNGAVWAQKEDPRVTRVGRVIRTLRIDEIPQMWNVLKGEMSFIGPRPERPEFVDVLEEKIPYYSLRHSVKPGITGWAQVNYPYGASEKDALEKLQYDLFYIKNLTPSLEFHILLKTVKVVLFGKGAR